MVCATRPPRAAEPQDQLRSFELCRATSPVPGSPPSAPTSGWWRRCTRPGRLTRAPSHPSGVPSLRAGTRPPRHHPGPGTTRSPPWSGPEPWTSPRSPPPGRPTVPAPWPPSPAPCAPPTPPSRGRGAVPGPSCAGGPAPSRTSPDRTCRRPRRRTPPRPPRPTYGTCPTPTPPPRRTAPAPTPAPVLRVPPPARRPIWSPPWRSRRRRRAPGRGAPAQAVGTYRPW